MKKYLLILLFIFLVSGCASTGVKNETQLRPDSADMANVYIKRKSGLLYMAVRTIVKLNGKDVGSVYPKEFVKIYVPEGQNIITIKADPLSGVFGKIDINMKFKKGKNYYFITGVNTANVGGAFLGGMIGTAIVGGPFPTVRVTKELFDQMKYS